MMITLLVCLFRQGLPEAAFCSGRTDRRLCCRRFHGKSGYEHHFLRRFCFSSAYSPLSA